MRLRLTLKLFLIFCYINIGCKRKNNSIQYSKLNLKKKQIKHLKDLNDCKNNITTKIKKFRKSISKIREPNIFYAKNLKDTKLENNINIENKVENIKKKDIKINSNTISNKGAIFNKRKKKNKKIRNNINLELINQKLLKNKLQNIYILLNDLYNKIISEESYFLKLNKELEDKKILKNTLKNKTNKINSYSKKNLNFELKEKLNQYKINDLQDKLEKTKLNSEQNKLLLFKLFCLLYENYKELNSKNNEITKYLKENERLKKRLNSKKAKCKKYKTLKKDFTSFQNVILNQYKNIVKIKNEILIKDNSRINYKCIIQKLLQNINYLNEELNKLPILKKQIEILNLEIDNKENEIIKINKNIKLKENKINLLSQENILLKTKINEQQNSKIENYQNIIEEYNTKLSEHKLHNKSLNDQNKLSNNKINALNKEIKLYINQINDLNDQVKILKINQISKTNKIGNYQNIIEEYNTKLSEHKLHNKSLNDQNKLSNDKIDSLNKEIKLYISQINALNDQVKILKINQISKTNKIGNYQKDIINLESKIDNLKNAKIRNYESKIKNLKNQILDYENKINTKNINSSIKDKIEKLVKENEIYKQQIEYFKSENNSQSEKINSLKLNEKRNNKKLEDNKREIINLKLKIKEIEKENERLQQENYKLSLNQNNKINQINLNNKIEIDKYKTRVTNLEDELRITKAEYEEHDYKYLYYELQNKFTDLALEYEDKFNQIITKQNDLITKIQDLEYKELIYIDKIQSYEIELKEQNNKINAKECFILKLEQYLEEFNVNRLELDLQKNQLSDLVQKLETEKERYKELSDNYQFLYKQFSILKNTKEDKYDYESNHLINIKENLETQNINND
ncbi:MAG: hypothetical protein GY830_07005 [Bacteroidetes bacterium]|nr:hypothetical protein [Bacteroidota bacterium]